MKTLIHRMVPFADGGLATDVYLPAGPGPFPVVLVRTPYHRSGLQALAPRFVERGYAFVTQDCRGKFDSDGSFTPLVFEAEDGLATLDWIANHSWCNGRIGMWGRSYLGIVQIPAAISGHQALRCIAPSVAPGSFFRDWLRYDGCFALANAVSWSLTHATCRTQPAMQHFDWGSCIVWTESRRLPNGSVSAIKRCSNGPSTTPTTTCGAVSTGITSTRASTCLPFTAAAGSTISPARSTKPTRIFVIGVRPNSHVLASDYSSAPGDTPPPAPPALPAADSQHSRGG